MEKNHNSTWQQRGSMRLIPRQYPNDVLGSYTGIPLDDDDDEPVQDADDL